MQTLLQATFQQKIQNVGLMLKIFAPNCGRFRTEQIHCGLETNAGLDVVVGGGGGGGGGNRHQFDKTQ